MLAVRHGDDNDDDEAIYIYIYIRGLLVLTSSLGDLVEDQMLQYC